MKKILLVISFAAQVLFLSCSEDPVSNPVGNRLPDTGLFLYPDSTIGQQFSRLQVHWWGDDPDGLILGFYIKWDEGYTGHLRLFDPLGKLFSYITRQQYSR